MEAVRRFLGSKVGRLSLAGSILLALSSPALAEHFNFDGDPPTAADLEVECAEAIEADCDAAVAEAFEELGDYNHPENHGKYVSFLAHCIPGGKGKGETMRQVAQASGNEAEELAVKLCAESKLEQAQADANSFADSVGSSSEDSDEDKGKDKGKGHKGGKGRGRPF